MIKDELVELISLHRSNYQKGEPTISDHGYDLLMKKLSNINPNHKLLQTPEPTLQIDTENTNKKIKHDIPMLSLDKVFTFEEVKKWCQKVARNIKEVFVIEPKYDGIAARWYTDKKKLVTRGNDGVFGEDVTDKLPIINFPFINDNTGVVGNTLPFSGEVIILPIDFKNSSIKRRDGKPYKTERNLVAGVMNRDDIPDLIGKVKLSFVLHDSEVKSVFPLSMLTAESWKYTLDDMKSHGFPLDGLVIKLNDQSYSKSLGSTSHHPRGQIAFKFPDEEVETILRGVKWQSGKRKLTPVGIVDPVIVGGVTVTNPSLHNAKNLIDRDLHIGDMLTIVRSGNVIPYVKSSEPGQDRQKIEISICPVCDADLDYVEPELYCSNPECGGRLHKQLSESVKVLGIDELGPPTIEKMIYDLGVDNILHILDLSIDDIYSLDGFADKSAQTLFQNIQKIKSNSVEDWRILASLNIKGIGKTLSKDILNDYTLIEIWGMSTFDFEKFPNFSFERASTLRQGLNLHQEILSGLNRRLKIIQTKGTKNTDKPTICLSGKFPRQKSYYEQIARNKGMEVVDKVTQDLTYLLAAGVPTIKVSKARKYGVQILDIMMFEKV